MSELSSIDPVTRLLRLVVKARSIGDITARHAWAQLLEVQPEQSMELLRGIAATIQLMHEAKECLAALDGIDKDLYLEPFVVLQEALTRMNLDENWSAARNRITDVAVNGLKFGADLVSRHWHETTVPKETLLELQTEIEALLNVVIESDELPGLLKSFLVENLEELRRGVLSYRLAGADGLRNALEKTIGAIAIRGGKLVEFDDEKSKKARIDFIGIIAKATKVVEFAQKVQTLVAPFTNLLLPPNP